MQYEAIIDTGATASFVSIEFVKRNRLPIVPLTTNRALEIANGRKGFLTYLVEIELRVDRHTKVLKYYVAPYLNYPIILGLP